MPVTSYEIASYHVSIISTADPNEMFATVSVFGASGNQLAFLRFYEPPVSLAPNEYRTDLGYPLISYSSSSLAGIVDVLRNEQPVYFTFFDYRPTRCFGSIGTSREPVGEGDA